MKHDRLALIFAKHLLDALDPDEQQDLIEWLNAKPANRECFILCSDPDWLSHEMTEFQKIDVEEARRKVFRKINSL